MVVRRNANIFAIGILLAVSACKGRQANPKLIDCSNPSFSAKQCADDAASQKDVPTVEDATARDALSEEPNDLTSAAEEIETSIEEVVEANTEETPTETASPAEENTENSKNEEENPEMSVPGVLSQMPVSPEFTVVPTSSSTSVVVTRLKVKAIDLSEGVYDVLLTFESDEISEVNYRISKIAPKVMATTSMDGGLLLGNFSFHLDLRFKNQGHTCGTKVDLTPGRFLILNVNCIVEESP